MLCISHPLNHRGHLVGGKNQKREAFGEDEPSVNPI